MWSGNHRRWSIDGHPVYHRRMRRWSEIAERVAATTKTSEKTAILADYLAGLTPEELPIAAVFLTGRPFAEADQRTIGLGWAGIARLGAPGRRRADADALRRAYDRSSRRRDRGRRRAGGGRPRARPGRRAHPARGRRRRSRPSRPPSGAGRQGASCSRTLIARSSPLTAERHRQGLSAASSGSGSARGSWRPPSRRPSTGRSTPSSGPGCSPATSGGPRCSPATTASPTPRSRSSTRSSSCSRRPPRTPPRSSAGSVPPSGSRTSTTASAPSCTGRGDEVRLYSRDLHDISGQFPEVVGRRSRAAVGRDPRRRAAGLAGRRRAAVPAAPGAPRAEEPVGEDPRGDAGDLRRVGRARPRTRDQDRRSSPARGAARRSAAGGSRRWPCRSPATAGAFALSYLASVDSVDGLEAAFLEARARRNEGLMVKDPDSRLLARPPRATAG